MLVNIRYYPILCLEDLEEEEWCQRVPGKRSQLSDPRSRSKINIMHNVSLNMLHLHAPQ